MWKSHVPQAFDLIAMWYCVDCYSMMIWVRFQHSDERVPCLVAAVFVYHQWTCTTAAIEGLGIHWPFTLLLCFSLWAKPSHDNGHSSDFLHDALFVTVWLAEAAQAIDSPEPCYWQAAEQWFHGDFPYKIETHWICILVSETKWSCELY